MNKKIGYALGVVMAIGAGLILWYLNTIAIVPTYAFISWVVSLPAVYVVLLTTLVIVAVSSWMFKSAVSDVVLGVGALGVLLALACQPYFNSLATLHASQFTQSEDADALSYQERVPFDVAEALSTKHHDDSINFHTLPGQDASTALVNREGFLNGYDSTKMMSLPLYSTVDSSPDPDSCSFAEDASLRLGGALPHENMAMHAYRKVSPLNPTIHINESDAFALCENDVPMIYMPATKASIGFFATHRVPAGVVVYNGHTGELTHHESLKSTGLPVYPASLAAEQRESLRASESIIDYFASTGGYSSTSDEDDDVNASNATEIALVSTQGNSEYVTPLVKAGIWKSSVVGLSHLSSEDVVAGALNPLSVSTYERPRRSPTAVIEHIITKKFPGYTDNDLTVFEVVPSDQGAWTAFIGRDQEILYRALIGSYDQMVLTDADGAILREGSDVPLDLKKLDKPLDQMSAEELIQASDEMMGELMNRAESPAPAR